MEHKLKGIKVAVLVADGFEQFEFTATKDSLLKEEAEVIVVAPKNRIVPTDQEEETGVLLHADSLLERVGAENFDALVIPGGVDSIESLRMNEKAINFVKHFIQSNKPIASLSHGQCLLIETDEIKNRVVTSDEIFETDFKSSGAEWIDQDMVVDGNLLTCKGMDNFVGFTDKMSDLFAKSNELQLKVLNQEETSDERLQSNPTDGIGENPSKKWGVSEFS